MTSTLVRRMLERIEQDYARVRTLRSLSAMFGRHPAYLSVRFQQEVGEERQGDRRVG